MKELFKCDICSNDRPGHYVVIRKVNATQYKKVSGDKTSNGLHKYIGEWKTEDTMTTKKAMFKCYVCDTEYTDAVIKENTSISGIEIKKMGVRILDKNTIDTFFGSDDVGIVTAQETTKDFKQRCIDELDNCKRSADIQTDFLVRMLKTIENNKRIDIVVEAVGKGTGLTSATRTKLTEEMV